MARRAYLPARSSLTVPLLPPLRRSLLGTCGRASPLTCSAPLADLLGIVQAEGDASGVGRQLVQNLHQFCVLEPGALGDGGPASRKRWCSGGAAEEVHLQQSIVEDAKDCASNISFLHATVRQTYVICTVSADPCLVGR
jgi:hypothetical protein